MTRLSVRSKILLITLTILVATVVVQALVVGYSFRKRFIRVLESESLYVAQGLKLQLDRLFALGLPLDGIAGFEEQCLEAVQEHEDVAYALVMDEWGRTLFHSDPTRHGQPVGIDASILLADHETVDVAGDGGIAYLATTLPIRDPDGRPVGAVRVGVPMSTIGVEMSQLLTRFIAVGAILLALATTLLVATLWFSVHRPLSKLVEVIRRVGAESDLTERVDVASTDELGQLGNAFNRMLAALANTQAEVEGYAHDLEHKTVELQDVNERLHDDIRERKRAQDALHKSEEKFRQYFELSLMGMAIVSPGRRWLEVNDKLCSLLGYTREQLQRMTLTEMVHDEERVKVETELQRVATRASEGFTLDTRISSCEGQRIFVTLSAKVVPRPDGDVDYLLVLVLDITERRRAEEILLQSQKVESLGLLAGGVAHDFNNLLTAMLVQSSLALSKLPPDSEAHLHVEKVVKATERASDLTRQLLAYSGRGQFEIHPLQLNEFIEESLPLLELAMPKHVTLQPDLDRSLPFVEADNGQMQQVVMNLVINAAEAIGDRPGTVVVSTGAETLRGREESLWTFDGEPPAPGRYVTLTVWDDGCGMDAPTRSKIFDPFFSTKFTGRGLGLAAVLGVVRGHHGAIRVKSRIGVGTTFTLFFPASDAKPPQVKPVESVTSPPCQGVVLIIDDEDFVREATSDILRSEGMQVITAANGTAGIALYRSKQPNVSLVLLDLSMPGLNGVETFAELQKIRSDVPVILTSGYSEEEVTHRFANVGLTGFLKKPFGVSHLMEIVSKHLA